MLIVLLARGLTLPGAIDGIKFYLYPDPARLVDPQVNNELSCPLTCVPNIIIPKQIGDGNVVVVAPQVCLESSR